MRSICVGVGLRGGRRMEVVGGSEFQCAVVSSGERTTSAMDLADAARGAVECQELGRGSLQESWRLQTSRGNHMVPPL